MPFSFDEVYRLTDVSGSYLDSPMVALGVRKVQAPEAGEGQETYQFLVNNPVHGGHQVIGKIVRDEEGVIELADSSKKTSEGKSVRWRFEPLTFDMWKAMGEAGSVGSYEEFLRLVENEPYPTRRLKQEYRDLYLDTDWWTEDPEGLV